MGVVVVAVVVALAGACATVGRVLPAREADLCVFVVFGFFCGRLAAVLCCVLHRFALD